MIFSEDAFFKSKSYAVEMTQDGSPTLRPEQRESMHHMGGAASESVYLYYEALLRYHSLHLTAIENPSLRVLSFGFGMGYNEILTVLFFLNRGLNLSRLQLVSREKDAFLYDLFNQWLCQKVQIDSVFDEVYAGIVRSLPVGTAAIPIEWVKKKFLELLELGQWQQNGPVTVVDDFEGPFDVVFYDAFSAKTNEHLWSEDFLNLFFKTQLSQSFVFSTYACTAVLKRVAAAQASHFNKREGFKGKRNSSLIHR